MSIEWCRKVNEESTAIDERGQQTFHSVYLLKSDTPEESRDNVLFSELLPTYGAPHPQNAFSICTKKDATRKKEDPHFWDAWADWGSNTGHRNPQDDQKRPDQRRPKWSGRFSPINQFRYFDRVGNYFTDRAGTPFNPPPGIPIFVDEITIQRYEATLDRVADRGFLNATNTDTWNGADPYTALIAEIDFQEVFEFGQYWFLKTYKVLVNPRIAISSNEGVAILPLPQDAGTPVDLFYGGWSPYFVLNAGPKEIDATTKKPVTIQDENNVLDGQPWPLDANGKKIDRDGTGKFSSALTFLAFAVVGAVEFSPLNLTPPWEA